MTATGETTPAATTSPEVSAGGGSPPEPAVARLSPQLPRKGPALIFLGLVAVVALGGFLLAALSSGSKVPPAALGQVTGSTISAASASGFISRIAVAGEPPANVTEAVVVPQQNATLTSSHREAENLERHSPGT